MATDTTTKNKLMVLDTNVLIHDPHCLSSFAEHNVLILQVVLEELDNLKKDPGDRGYRAREALRALAQIIEHPGVDRSRLATDGVPIDPSSTPAQGNLIVRIGANEQTTSLVRARQVKADHVIVDEIKCIREAIGEQYEDVVLVSNDTYPRLLAYSAGVRAEEYRNDIAVRDTDLLPTGMLELSPECWESRELLDGPRDEARRVRIPLVGASAGAHVYANQLVHDGNGQDMLIRQVEADAVVAVHARNYRTKNRVFGIAARNREQNYALNLLMDPAIHCVTLLGPAGTGKTLLSLVAAYAQLDSTVCAAHRAGTPPETYRGIIMTRATISVGPEIGFLKGNEVEKMSPWMHALFDNLEAIAENLDEAKAEAGHAPTVRHKGAKGETQANGSVERCSHLERSLASLVDIRSMNFFRGATFYKRFVIVDEVQNLTRHQVRMLVTRAGPGTKFVLMGNLTQIDTPFLSAHTSGLAHMAARFFGEEICGHVILNETVRSPLASLAEAKL